jgi:nucleotide-binding universal stress UspA family protein
MKQIKKIVAALDLSTYSQEILEHSLNLAKGISAQVIIVNVINRKSVDAARQAFNAEHPNSFLPDKYIGDDRERRKRMLEDLLAVCGGKETDTKITVRYGIPFEEILTALDEEGGDLLVIGQKGRTNLPEFLFGTTAEKLFRHSPVPVFSIRKE